MKQFPDINRYKQRLEILTLLKAQLEKDFDLSQALVLDDNALLAYEQLFTQLLPLVKNIDRSSSSGLAQLLYRIDVSESKILEALHSNPEQDYLEVATQHILERELIKVLTRLYF